MLVARKRLREGLLRGFDLEQGALVEAPSAGSQLDQVFAPVGRIGPTADDALLLEGVDQADDRRPVDSEPFAEPLLRSWSFRVDEGHDRELADVDSQLRERFVDRRRQQRLAALEQEQLPVGQAAWELTDGPVLAHVATLAARLFVSGTDRQYPYRLRGDPNERLRRVLLDSPRRGGLHAVIGVVGLSLGYFMVMLDTTVVTVALPSIGHDFQSSVADLQWVSNGYSVTFAAGLLGAGSISDRFGARRIFLIGTAMFALGSAVAIFTPTLWFLVAIRAVIGLGGAALLPSSLSLIARGFRDPRARARAVGAWAAISGVALAAGPLVGGALVDSLGWRSVLALNVPTGLLSACLVIAAVASVPPNPDSALNVSDQALVVFLLAAISYGSINGGSRGWLAPATLAPLGAALLAVVPLALLQRRRAVPLIPPPLLRAGLPATFGAGVAVNFGFSGLLFALSLYLQTGRNLSALEAGLLFLPLTATMALNAFLTGRLVGRFGADLPMVAGFLVAAAGAVAVSLAVAGASLALAIVALLVLGVGASWAIPAMVAATIAATQPSHVGTATGALNASRQAGAVLGVAALGSVLASRPTLAAGTVLALLLAALAFVAGALLANRARRQRRAEPT